MLRFKNLAEFIRYRNSDILQMNRHRFARRPVITAKTSSEDRNALGVNSRWNAGSFNSCKIARAKHQNPQSSTLYEANCSFFLL